MAKSHFFGLFLCTIIPVLHADNEAKPSFDQLLEKLNQEPGYVINFKDVSALEVVKFLSKVGDLNFIYDENDLNFNVTILSEGQTSLANILSAFMQVLRIHNLLIIEDGKNLIIHSNPAIKEMAPIISDVTNADLTFIPPFITRVFYIEKGNPNTIANILRPMISSQAMVEISTGTRHLIVTDVVANVQKIAQLLLTLDAEQTALEVGTYQAKNNPIGTLEPLLKQLLTPLSQGNPLIFVAQAETNTLYIVTSPYLLKEAMMLLTTIDAPPTVSLTQFTGNNVLVYQIEQQPHGDLEASIKALGLDVSQNGLQPSNLSKTIETMRYVPESNALIFTGDPASITALKSLLTQFDTAYAKSTQDSATSNLLVYQVKNFPSAQFQTILSGVIGKLEHASNPDPTLLQSLKNMKLEPATNSLVFTGTPATLIKVKSLIESLDVSVKGPMDSGQFFIYTPHMRTGKDLLSALDELVANLKSSGLADPVLIKALLSAKYNASSNTITFTGDQPSLDRISALMTTLDTSISAADQPQLFLYPLQNRSKIQFEEEIHRLEGTLPKGDSLRISLENVRYMPESHSFAFWGNPHDIAKLKDLLLVIDSKEGNSGAVTFSLYKLKNAPGDEVLRDLRQMADHLQASGIQSSPLIHTIDSIKYIKSTNALYITGTPEAIQEVLRLINDFDVVGSPDNASNFYMYKPKYISLDKLKSTLFDVAADFKAAGLEDPSLIQTILAARTVEATQSILFTGSPTVILRLHELVASIDTADNEQPIKQIGSTTFLIYKLKYLSGPQLTKSLRQIISDLQKTGDPDPDLVKTIEHMRFVPETNSVIFTGTKESLAKVQALVDKFDTEGAGGPAAPAPEKYVIYKPKNLSGEELIQVLHDFEHNLTNAGVSDKELIDTINNLKWMDKTSTILVSGSEAATQRCVELLEKFDVSSKDGTAGTSIETIDDTSFLLYKLQYHQGNEIQTALQAISRDVRQNENATTANTLSNTIASIQWLQVTNTLIGSGNAQTLDKVRELIKGLDAPLKQVFIEVLVLELSDNDSVSLGLNWRQSGVWRNKLAFTASNYNPANTATKAATGSDPLQSFINGVSGTTGVNATTRPNSNTMLPFTAGGDLGIIGDVILHHGSTFFSLSDFITALGVESTSTIVLNQKLVTQDNQLATLFVGDNLPFTGSLITTTQASGGTTQAGNVEYRDIGVKLNITPRIGDDNVVTLEIDEDITEQTNTGNNDSQVSSNQLGAISSSRRTTQTRVTMPDRHFLVLSGQIRNTTTRTKSYIPCLGTLPVVGAAFSQNDSIKATTNIVIFIRPQILHTTEEYIQITQYQEDLYRQQSMDKESYDAGLELVKTPDDE